MAVSQEEEGPRQRADPGHGEAAGSHWTPGACLQLVLDRAKDVPLPKVQKEEIHPLSEEQAAHLLPESVGDTWHALDWLALDSGARQGELWA